jgi:hypothetical protein
MNKKSNKNHFLKGVAQKTSQLLQDSKVYEKRAKDLNSWLYLKQYGPFISVLFIVIFLFWVRFYFW